MKLKLKTKRVVLVILLVLVLLVIRPVTFLLYTYIKDQKAIEHLPVAVVNDASQLNQTKVDTVVKVPKEINHAISESWAATSIINCVICCSFLLNMV